MHGRLYAKHVCRASATADCAPTEEETSEASACRWRIQWQRGSGFRLKTPEYNRALRRGQKPRASTSELMQPARRRRGKRQMARRSQEFVAGTTCRAPTKTGSASAKPRTCAGHPPRRTVPLRGDSGVRLQQRQEQIPRPPRRARDDRVRSLGGGTGGRTEVVAAGRPPLRPPRRRNSVANLILTRSTVACYLAVDNSGGMSARLMVLPPGHLRQPRSGLRGERTNLLARAHVLADRL